MDESQGPALKTCRRCDTEKPLDEFSPHKRSADKRGYYCRPCIRVYAQERNGAVRKRYAEDFEFRAKRREYHEAWLEKNPEYKKQRKRLWDLGKKGLTPRDYDEMLAQQGNGCYLCGGGPSRTPYLHIDHDHATGVVRGLLCDSCNLGLGKFRDNADVLRKAIDYLTRDTGFRVRDKASYRPWESAESEPPTG